MPSTRPNPRRTNGSKRTALLKRVRAEENECWLCSQPVDKSLPPGLPGSPEVHEVIPTSRGGSPYDRSNCHLTHRLCNQRQGNRLPDEPLPPPGRRRYVQPIDTTRDW